MDKFVTVRKMNSKIRRISGRVFRWVADEMWSSGGSISRKKGADTMDGDDDNKDNKDARVHQARLDVGQYRIVREHVTRGGGFYPFCY